MIFTVITTKCIQHSTSITELPIRPNSLLGLQVNLYFGPISSLRRNSYNLQRSLQKLSYPVNNCVLHIHVTTGVDP